MKERLFIVSISIALIIALVIFGMSFFRPKTYSSAKNECQSILSKYQDEFESIPTQAFQTEGLSNGEFKKFSWFEYDDYIKFEIDSQGMLGGQYWSLVYTFDGIYQGETNKYLYKEKDGNNIVKGELLQGHWWFLWEDYDGTKYSDE